jgi:hypothetical protein
LLYPVRLQEDVLPGLAAGLELAAAERQASAHHHHPQVGGNRALTTSKDSSATQASTSNAKKSNLATGKIPGNTGVATKPPPSTSLRGSVAYHPSAAVTPQSLAKRHSLTGPLQQTTAAGGGGAAAAASRGRGPTSGGGSTATRALSMSMSFAAGDLSSALGQAVGVAAGRTPPRASPLGGGSLIRAAAAASPSRDALQVGEGRGSYIAHSWLKAACMISSFNYNARKV